MPFAPADIDTWIFDLDNTLYPASSRLFDQVDARMNRFIRDLLGLDASAAHRLQKALFASHGTTLAGLMALHGVDADAFLDFVHDIDLTPLAADADVGARLQALPGRKLVFTNGDATYAARLLDRLGLAAIFEGVHDIRAMALVPKPAPQCYAGLCARWQIDPARALFVDDMARNLAPAKALGMTTVWLDNGSEQAGGRYCPDFVDLRIDDLADWLATLGLAQTNKEPA